MARELQLGQKCEVSEVNAVSLDEFKSIRHSGFGPCELVDISLIGPVGTNNCLILLKKSDIDYRPFQGMDVRILVNSSGFDYAVDLMMKIIKQTNVYGFSISNTDTGRRITTIECFETVMIEKAFL